MSESPFLSRTREQYKSHDRDGSLPQDQKETTNHPRPLEKKGQKKKPPPLALLIAKKINRILQKNTKQITTGIQKHWKKAILGTTATGILFTNPAGLNTYKSVTTEIRHEVLRGKQATPQEMQEMRTNLSKEFPHINSGEELRMHSLGMYDYRKNRVETLDDDFAEYLSMATFEDMKKDGVLPATGEILKNNYLDTDHMWELKQDAALVTSALNQESIAILRARVKNAPQEKRTLEELYTLMDNTVKEVRAFLEKNGAWKSSPLDDAFSADTLLSIVLHEIIPTGYHPLAKVHIMRALLDAGWQPWYTPAIHDPVASFGLFQTTRMTHQDVCHRFRKTTAHFGIGDFEETLDPKKQTVIATLLMFQRVGVYKDALAKNTDFLKLWKQSTSAQRHAFSASFAAALHNGPLYADKGYHHMLERLESCRSLEDARSIFLEGIPTGYTRPHAEDTGHTGQILGAELSKKSVQLSFSSMEGKKEQWGAHKMPVKKQKT